MRFVRRPLALALVFICGLSHQACVSKRSIAFPDDASIKTLIIVRAIGGEVKEARAIDASQPVTFTVTPGSEDGIYLVAYTCAKELLGLTLGADGHLMLGDPNGGALPKDHGIFRIDPASWTLVPVSSRPPVIDSVKVSRSTSMSRCSQIDLERVSLPESPGLSIRFSFALDARRVLLGGDNVNGDPKFFIATRSSTGASVRELMVAPALPHVGQFRADDGELWLIGFDGELSHGTFERGFVDGPRSSLRRQYLVWVAGQGRGRGVEMLVVSKSGEIELYRGEAWSPIVSDIVCGPLDICTKGAVIRIGPSKYLLGRPTAAGVFLVDTSSAVTLRQVALPDTGTSPVAFGRDADGTVYVSAVTTEVFDLAKSPDGGNTWHAVLSSPNPIETILPFQGSVFFTARGALHQLAADGSDCNLGQLGFHVATSTVVGDAMAFGTEATNGSVSAPASVFFATVRPPAPEQTCD